MKRAFVLFLISNVTLATMAGAQQSDGRWDFGVSSHYAQEFFREKFTNTAFGPALITYKNERSKVAFGGGFWAERWMSRHLSLLAQLDYHYTRVDAWLMTGAISKAGNNLDFTERSQSLAASLKGRWYFNPQSKVKWFAEAGTKADRIVRFRHKYWRYDFKQSNPPLYNAIVPGLVVGAGVRWRRLGVAAEYQRYVLNDAYTDLLAAGESQGRMRRDLSRQNVTLTATFSLARRP
nr:hypothetical protein [uncultured Dyadobacter sp.]